VILFDDNNDYRQLRYSLCVSKALSARFQHFVNNCLLHNIIIIIIIIIIIVLIINNKYIIWCTGVLIQAT